MAGLNTDYTVALKDDQYAFLKKMAKEYNLADESKALRCLLDFAITENYRQDEIFGKVRCRRC